MRLKPEIWYKGEEILIIETPTIKVQKLLV
jgi:hypothetical protein